MDGSESFERHEMRSSRKRGKMRWLTYQTWEIATPVCLDVNHGHAASGALFAKDANVILTFY
jgi:hypothetical protein